MCHRKLSIRNRLNPQHKSIFNSFLILKQLQDLFSTTAGILYFNDLKLDFYVLLGLGISFLGAFMFSYLKVREMSETKGKMKKFDDESLHEEDDQESKNGFIVYTIEPQIK